MKCLLEEMKHWLFEGLYVLSIWETMGEEELNYQNQQTIYCLSCYHWNNLWRSQGNLEMRRG